MLSASIILIQVGASAIELLPLFSTANFLSFFFFLVTNVAQQSIAVKLRGVGQVSWVQTTAHELLLLLFFSFLIWVEPVWGIEAIPCHLSVMLEIPLTLMWLSWKSKKNLHLTHSMSFAISHTFSLWLCCQDRSYFLNSSWRTKSRYRSISEVLLISSSPYKFNRI